MPKKSKETLPETAAGGEQFVKVAQADDTNPDAREASPEEMEAMLQGKNRTHFEGLGDAWAVLTGQNPAAVMPWARCCTRAARVPPGSGNAAAGTMC